MKIETNPLWKKLEIFSIDPPDVQFTFTQRLARENSWSEQYAAEVVHEYKKFIFLCAIQDLACTPSHDVDQAWHLHLSYTKSYWNDLCENLLGKKIHHNPTEGGQSETEKFFSFYEFTLSLYRTTFETEPPENIWPASEARFSSSNSPHITAADHWIIRKKIWHLPILVLFIFLIIALLSKHGEIMIGGIFLALVISSKTGNGRSGSIGGCGSGCNSAHGCSGCSGDGGCSSGCSGCGGGD
ncbi:hypothetical protein HHL16_21160 [Pseudoflavitalea sp. G-6-1-2]|uniref:glycine-rich domain-containing protein n=1 Tax=Pseudoflavitalea sp. G-6-1-2 TaxID=2728841 RepID=UPI00146D3CF6|nr:hypothetical protein [Pseudoflavitalea sp. G-6-1-2]NML23403.1 hypothetical protein [Pseudoflavitalea sp. G-6-1-2]